MNRYKITKELKYKILRSNRSLDEISRAAGFNVKNVCYTNSSISEDNLRKLGKVLNLNNLKLIRFKFDYSKNLGIYSATQPIKPLVKCNKLAEFIGIMLGDGNVYKNSVTIAFDKRNKKYIDYVHKLCKSISGINFKSKEVSTTNGGYLYCYNKYLVEELILFGLKRGNKIKNRIGMPNWIMNNSTYSKNCVRGLIDTDGCVYNCKRDKNIYIKFTNYNLKLLEDFTQITKNLGYSFAKANKTNKCLYRKNEVAKFIKDIKPLKADGVIV